MQISGEASAAFVKANNGFSQYSFNRGDGTFTWRWDIFADASITDDITFLSNFRMLQDQIPHIDLFALRVSDIASTGINLQFGEVDIPFGNLGEDRFPKNNPFLALPFVNEHYTALCKSDYNLWTFSPEYSMDGDGVRILDQGLYDLGIKVYGNVGIVEYGFALINGMASATGTYSPNGLNSNHGFGKIGRLAITPFDGLKIGASYGYGPFMREISDTNSQLYNKHPDDYTQHISEGDLRFDYDYFSFSGDIVYNRWLYVQNLELTALSYSGMIKYTFSPRIFGALRASTIKFNKISIREYIPETGEGYYGPIGFVLYRGKWDHDAVRIEGSAGYRIEKNLLLKIHYQINKTYDLPSDPVDNVMAIQTVISF